MNWTGGSLKRLGVKSMRQSRDRVAVRKYFARKSLERQLKTKLSDADCDRMLTNKASAKPTAQIEYVAKMSATFGGIDSKAADSWSANSRSAKKEIVGQTYATSKNLLPHEVCPNHMENVTEQQLNDKLMGNSSSNINDSNR